MTDLESGTFHTPTPKALRPVFRALAAGCLAAALSPLAAQAQEDVLAGEILPNEAAPQADVPALEAETVVLEAISQGVALSLAYCQGEEACDPAVSREELSQLVQTVDRRITALAVRYNEGGEAGLDEVLVAYAAVRDEYNRHLEQLEEVTAAGEAPLEAAEALADAPAEATRTSAAPEELPATFDIFEDADEPLAPGPEPGTP